MKNKLLVWEIGGFLFIGLVGAALHFTFEMSNFSSMEVAYFSAVNESTWEHLKMVFFPGLVFALIQYTYVRDVVNNYIVAKVAGLVIMPLVIAGIGETISERAGVVRSLGAVISRLTFSFFIWRSFLGNGRVTSCSPARPLKRNIPNLPSASFWLCSWLFRPFLFTRQIFSCSNILT